MSTKIEWCDATINPVVGCSHCSPGCDHCYAERFAARLAKNPKTAAKYAGVVNENGKWTGKVQGQWIWNWPSPLNKRAKRIFVGSMCDMFHDNVDLGLLTKVFAIAAICRQHTFVFLTKRPQRMLDVISDTSTAANGRLGKAIQDVAHIFGVDANMDDLRWPLPNLWLGVTVCNQAEADEKILVLLETPAAKRFVSVEPCLGPVEIGKYLYGSYECGLSCGTRLPCTALPELQCTKCGFVGPDDYETWGDGDCKECPQCHQDGCCGAIEEICPDCGHYMVQYHPDTPVLDWVICGGETGPRARPMHPDWVRSLRDQCQAAGTLFFFKSWGEWQPVGWVHAGTKFDHPHIVLTQDGRVVRSREDLAPSHNFALRRVGKRRAGRLLDGREWNEVPEASC